MQLEHIILFDKIAHEKSISKVAAANHVTQPALSQQMQRLEEEVGLKLLERSNRGIELTEAGKIMFKYAQQFKNIYQNFLADVSNLQNNSGTFRISATSVAGNYAIPCTLCKLKATFSQFNFSLSSMPSSDVVRQVLEGNADIGFIVGTVNEPDLICKKSFSDKIQLVAAKDYNVKDQIELSELQKHPLIMLNENFSSYRLLVVQLKKLGYNMEEFKVLYNLDSTESVKSLVISKHGMAFLPNMAIKKELYLGQLKLVEVENVQLSYDVSTICKVHSIASDHLPGKIIKYLEHIVKQAMC